MQDKPLCTWRWFLRWFPPIPRLIFYHGNEIRVVLIISKCLGIQTFLSPLRLLLALFHGVYQTEKNKARYPSAKLGCIIRNYRKEVTWHSSPRHLSRFSLICWLSLATEKLQVCLCVTCVYFWRCMNVHAPICYFENDHRAAIITLLIGLWSENNLSLFRSWRFFFLRSNVLGSLFERNLIMRANVHLP